MSNLPSKYFNMGGRIENQTNSNWCAGYSTTSYLTAFMARKFGRIIEFSPLFAMKNAKEGDGLADNVTGTHIKVLMDEMIDYGCCEEVLYPTSLDGDFHDNKFPATTKACEDNAKLYKPIKKKILNEDSVDELKNAIVHNGGCVAGILLYPNYMHRFKGIYIRRPDFRGHVLGKHAIYMSGYNDDLEMEYDGEKFKGFFILQESYGDRTKSGGYLFLPYAIVKDRATGLYSMDKFMNEAYCFEYGKGEDKFPNFHDKFEVEQPKQIVTLTIGSTIMKVDGVNKTMSIAPIVENGRTFIPLRAVAEAFGVGVFFDNTTKTIRMSRLDPSTRIEMSLNSNEVIKTDSKGNSVTIISDTKPIIRNNTTLVPIRLIGEMLGYTVDYSQGVITISTY